MGMREDLERYRKVGEENRQDLADFIQYGDLGESLPHKIRIPIKIVDLPEFEYDRRDKGGVGQGQDGTPDVGDQVSRPQPGEGDGEEGDDGEPGEGEGEHGYYEMDPEEFAQELDEELGLDLEPKGKKITEEKEGDLTDIVRSGPSSTLDFRRMFKEALKRKLGTDFDPNFVEETLKVEGVGPETAFEWLRKEKGITVSKKWIQNKYEDIPPEERSKWGSLDEMQENVTYIPTSQKIKTEGVKHLPFRTEDERYRYPEIIEERESKVVVVNIRDVSASMREKKRELVERTFTPIDWYLQGKYDNAEFIYIAHDVKAWQVERDEFFGIKSGGGTRISSAYELAQAVLEERYPWHEWNRYVFAAGDSENSSQDTEQKVIPLMEEIDANLHAYIETQPEGGGVNATHAKEVEDHFESDDVVVSYVKSQDDVMDAIYDVLSVEQ
ncbi:MAG: YeaH/YhbH family protein [Halobacteria archaeon]|nr:YeaH/YhbH family protein [Halobacteria archaeon]